MRIRTLLYYFIVVAVSGSIGFYMGKDKEKSPSFPDPVRVIVARKNIPAIEPITVEMLSVRKIRKDYVHANSIYSNESDLLVGKELRWPTRAGSPILWHDLR